MEQSQETLFSRKSVSRRTILKILGASGAAVASFLVAPAAWSKPNISAITSLLLGDATDSLTDDIELTTTQDEDAECHDESMAGDSCRLLPLGAIVAAGGSAMVDNRAGDTPNTPNVWCSNNWTYTSRSRFQLNLTSNYAFGSGPSDPHKTGPWNFTCYRSVDNLSATEYPELATWWKPLGSSHTFNLTQSPSADGVWRTNFREYNSIRNGATSYQTQLRHAVYNMSSGQFTHFYSKNLTTPIRYNLTSGFR